MPQELKIEPQAAVEVYQVANGYLVKLPHMLTRGDYQPIESALVFQTFAELMAWMNQHFTHRAQGLAVDGA